MLSFPTALAGAAVTAGVVAATYWYFSRKAAATLLTVIDDSGNSFAADQATSYCAEDAYTRLARDIVVRTASNTFLVRKWGGGGHRAGAAFGNAFGTFFYRPPKNIPASDNDTKFATVMWDVEIRGWLLTFAIDGLGVKNRELSNMFGPTAKEAMLLSALDDKANCYVMPSSSQSDKASIAAPMTVLVSFVEHEEIDLSKFPDFAWASLQQALDPRFNVHAGVIARYCLEKGMAESELLREHGWAEAEMPMAVRLPERLSTLRAWGADVASVYTSMKGLLREQSRSAPLPRRTCEPRAP